MSQNSNLEFHRETTLKQIRREKRQDVLYQIEVAALNVGAWVLIPIPLPKQNLTCPSCRRQVPSASKYCSFCGACLQDKLVLKICSDCCNRIPVSSRFCPECGHKQANEQ